MGALKMNTLLGKVDHGSGVFKTMTSEYKQFFDKGQGNFKGVRKTYTPREGMADDPSMRQFSKVVTTVKEKFDWYEDKAAEFINGTLAIDATNGRGAAKVDLVVGGQVIAKMNVLELMKLKSIITKMGMTEMYTQLPVRSDAEIWKETDDEMYVGREIFETELSKGIKRTDSKFEYILEDPNLKNMSDTSRYTPQKSVKSSIIEVGDYTVQNFSGETTQRYKASILDRRSTLLEAIEVAIKEANDVTVDASDMNAKKLFDYLHRGVIN
jgi:hypothetical protein